MARRTRRLRRGFRSRLGPCAAAAKHKHENSESEQHDSPVEIDINSKRLLVERRVTRYAVNQKNQSQQRKQNSQRQPYVDAHPLSYQKIIFSNTVPASTIIASDAGPAYQAVGSSSGLGVSEYTRPTSLLSSGARVIRLTTIVTTKQVLHA